MDESIKTIADEAEKLKEADSVSLDQKISFLEKIFEMYKKDADLFKKIKADKGLIKNLGNTVGTTTYHEFEEVEGALYTWGEANGEEQAKIGAFMYDNDKMGKYLF